MLYPQGVDSSVGMNLKTADIPLANTKDTFMEKAPTNNDQNAADQNTSSVNAVARQASIVDTVAIGSNSVINLMN